MTYLSHAFQLCVGVIIWWLACKVLDLQDQIGHLRSQLSNKADKEEKKIERDPLGRW